MNYLIAITFLFFSLTSFGQRKELVNEHTRCSIFYNGDTFQVNFLDNGNQKTITISFSEDELESFEKLLNRSFNNQENIQLQQDGTTCQLLAKHNGCLFNWGRGETLIFRIELDKFVNYEKVTYLKRKIEKEKAR